MCIIFDTEEKMWYNVYAFEKGDLKSEKIFFSKTKLFLVK